VLIAAIAAAAPNAPPLDVQMTLSSDTILLGEPLWVDVHVTNRSSTPLSVDMGNNCFGAKPLIVEVPQAEPRIDKQRRCGVVSGGGSCLALGPQSVPPGGTLTKRYLFTGDFRIIRAGRYAVRLTKILQYGPASSSPSSVQPMLPDGSPRQRAVVDTTVDVLPANPEKLLDIEHGLIAQATATWAPGIYDLNARAAKSEAQRSMMDGIVTYPAVGLEPIFNSWFAGPGANYNAAMGLFQLNTREAREDLASFINIPPNRNTSNLRDVAISYLGEMGDTSYLPLLERAIDDPDFTTRQWAVAAFARLGGELAVPKLEVIAKHPQSMWDRNDAITALGETASPKAVPVLLSLFSGEIQWDAGVGYALFLLTHHELSAADRQSDQAMQSAWKTWWEQNQTTARIFHSWEDCPEQKDLVISS
jgi:hypothetical protein